MKTPMWTLLGLVFLAMGCTEAPPAAMEDSESGASKQPTVVEMDASGSDTYDCGDFEMLMTWTQPVRATYYWNNDGTLDRVFFQAWKGGLATYANGTTGKSISAKFGQANKGWCNSDQLYGGCRFAGNGMVVHVPGYGVISLMAGALWWDAEGNVMRFVGNTFEDGSSYDAEALCAYLREP